MLVGYARVSTRDQTHALQLDALSKAGCERIFEETASGAQRDRPQLAAALDYVRKGDAIVVWKLDRLARSIKQLIETVEHLERREIGFRSLTEQIDTTTAGGRLIFHIFGALAEFERSIIRERSRAGLEAARARGRIGGRFLVVVKVVGLGVHAVQLPQHPTARPHRSDAYAFTATRCNGGERANTCASANGLAAVRRISVAAS